MNNKVNNQQNRPLRTTSRITGWWVDVQDQEGKITRRKLDVTATYQLERGLRVLVPFNDGTRQPRCQGGHLFNWFCSNLGGKWMQLPLYYKTWKQVPAENKNALWNEIVKEKFLVEGRELMKDYAFLKMCEGWRSKRNRLYNKMQGDGTKTLQELIANVPDGVPPDMWARFVQHKRSTESMRMSERNAWSRSHLVIHHTLGAKAMQVRYSELEEEAKAEGRKTNYGELYVVTHRHKDGSAVSQHTERQIERIQQTQERLNQQEAGEEAQGSKNPTTALKAAFDTAEHPGRVRGMGLGARPSKIYGKSSVTKAKTSHFKRKSCTNSAREIDVKVANFTRQANEFQGYMDKWCESMNAFIRDSWAKIRPGAVPPMMPTPSPIFRFQSPSPPEDDDTVNSRP